jgi:hypothetical protein
MTRSESLEDGKPNETTGLETSTSVHPSQDGRTEGESMTRTSYDHCGDNSNSNNINIHKIVVETAASAVSSLNHPPLSRPLEL